jgi:indole-3-glycerol phosphate synthase
MEKTDILKEIIAKKNEKIAAAKLTLTQQDLINRIASLAPARPFIEAILRPKNISLIAEIKKASPSCGIIRENFNHLEIAKIYQESGVQAISVLTEEDYFCGSLAYLEEINKAVPLPLLRKDFILEAYQVYESRVFGADAILLIAGLLSKERLTELISLSDSLGLDCLVEVHDEKELKKIIGLKVPFNPSSNNSLGLAKKNKQGVRFLIGINNRDLHTLETDFKTTEKLYPLIPKDRMVVVESGIKSYQDILFLKILGVNAVLVGESILKAEDIKFRIQELMGW